MRMLTVSTVHFQARAREDLHAELVRCGDRVDVPWHVVVAVAKRMLMHACRSAATAMLQQMAQWSSEQWAEQEEVREYRREHPAPETAQVEG